jgi:hypothetical protein
MSFLLFRKSAVEIFKQDIVSELVLRVNNTKRTHEYNYYIYDPIVEVSAVERLLQI